MFMGLWLVRYDIYQQEQFMAHNDFALNNNIQHPKESVLAVEVTCFINAVAKISFWCLFFNHLAAVWRPPAPHLTTTTTRRLIPYRLA